MKKSGKTAMTTAIFAAVLTASAAFGDEHRNCVWTGAAGDAKWSSPGNWADNAAPSSGDAVSVSGSGSVNGEIENDIEGLSLAKLTFEGSVPFRLKGKGIAFAAAGECIVKTASVSVTNAIDLALADGECVVNSNSKDFFVFEGVISGDAAMLHFLVGAKVYLAGNNTYGGGTFFESSNGIALGHPNGFGKNGTLVKAAGTVEFFVTGDINYDFYRYSGGNFRFRKAGEYNIRGKVYGDKNKIQLVGGDTSNVCGGNGLVVFHQEVDFPNSVLINNNLGLDWKVKFLAPTSFRELQNGDYAPGQWMISEFHATNLVSVLHPCTLMRIHTMTADAFPTRPVVMFDGGMRTDYVEGNGVINLCGNNQTFDRLVSKDSSFEKKGLVKSTGAHATLTLAGTDSAYTYACLAEELSVVWNPIDSSCTQTFANRIHTMSGAIIVSNGTFAAEGEISFANAKRIEIAPGGRLLINSSLANSFAGVEQIDIAKDAILEIVSGVTAFSPNKAVLNLATGASVVLPETDGYEFLGITKDGEKLSNGVFDSENLPEIRSGRVIARGQDAQRVDISWSGEGASFAASDDANWVGGAAPNLINGSLFATFGNGGEKAEIAAGYDWRGIEFTRDFEIAGSHVLTLREGGITAGAASPSTNIVSSPLWLRADQEWQVGMDSRLNVNGGVADKGYGSYSVHKTGAGELHLNAPSPGMGAFTLGSRGVDGGKVVVNASTNAFGAASDQEVRIYSVNSAGTGNLTLGVSTVIERPVVFDTYNDYGNILKMHQGVEARFTKPVTMTGNLRMSLDGKNKMVFEGGGEFLNGWLCFSSYWNIAENYPMSEWIFKGEKQYKINYLYMSGYVNVTLASQDVQLNTFEIKAKYCRLNLAVPNALNNDSTRGILDNADATLSITGDQSIGNLTLTAGTISSETSGALSFATADGIATNSSVKLTGGASLFKRGNGTFVQDLMAETTGGIGVGEGKLVLTGNARFPNSTVFKVLGNGRAELEARNLLGKNTKVYMETTAVLDLAGDQRVKELYVDGVRQCDGIYRFSGSGRLMVGNIGLLIKVR
jgi:hypothetical protein